MRWVLLALLLGGCSTHNVEPWSCECSTADTVLRCNGMQIIKEQ